jgi:hypothetical protein
MKTAPIIIAALSVLFLSGCGRNRVADVELYDLLEEISSPRESAIAPTYSYKSYAKFGETSDVLLSVEGTGAITRLRIDKLPERGRLNIYIDNAEQPAFVLDGAGWDVVAPNPGSALATPSTLHLPLLYNEKCDVIYSPPTDATPINYSIEYRTYEPDVRVAPFTGMSIDEMETELSVANRWLLSPDTVKNAQTVIRGESIISEGSPLNIELPEGGYAVQELRIELVATDDSSFNYQQAMRDVVIQGIFDGLLTIRAPLGEFSGGGMGAYPVTNPYMESDGKGNILSRWYMPYRQEARLSLINEGDSNHHIRYAVYLSPIEWSREMMYFNVSWRENLAVKLMKDTASARPWAFAVIRGGRGIYKGDALSVYNGSKGWFGRGKMQMWIDNEETPSVEYRSITDYYDMVGLPPYVNQTPFGGVIRADAEDSHGYTTLLRTRNIDAVAFNDSLRIGMQWIGEENGSIDCSTTIFWYGASGARPYRISRAEEKARKLLNPAKEQ